MNAELLKRGGPVIQREVHSLLQRVWQTEEIPDEWKTAVFISLHKKGEKTECSNYRGLSLLSVGYKIFAKIIYNRLLPIYEQCIGPYQTGFRKGMGTIDNIFALRQIGENTTSSTLRQCVSGSTPLWKPSRLSRRT